MERAAFNLDLGEFAGNAARGVLSQVGDLKQIRERPFYLLLQVKWFPFL